MDVAKIYDLDEERSKRGKPRVHCMFCERTVDAKDLIPVLDEAELYLVCKTCRPKMEELKLYKCDECGREVYTTYPDPSETRSLCAICVQQATEELTELNLSDDPIPDEAIDEDAVYDPSIFEDENFPDF